MRPLAMIALFGSVLSVAHLQAQNLAEHAAAAAGATIGTAAGKPMSNAITKIFGDTDDRAKAASRTTLTKPPTPTSGTPTPAPPSLAAGTGSAPASGGAGGGSAEKAGGGSEAGASELTEPASPRRRARSAARRLSQPETAGGESAAFIPAPPIVVEPPAPQEPTAEQVAGIQLGASGNDVIAALGAPASRVTIPDDDGHLRESFQFWAKGSQIGTVRLDNGYVVKVEARSF